LPIGGIIRTIRGVDKLLRLAYIKSDSFNEYDSQTIDGMTEAAKEGGARLIVFSGHAEYDAGKRNAGISALYGIIRAARPDGILANAWLPETRPPRTGDFLAAFPDTPVYFVGEGYLGRHYCHAVGRDYLRIILAHMIDVHGRRRVAFAGAQYPDDRDEAYISEMRSRGLWDERLYLEGSALRADSPAERGEEIVRILMDERRETRPDAILSMHTDETVRIVAALKERGVAIPGDIAVASWEDGEAGRCSDPPITCVEVPYYELGRASCAQLIRLLRGRSVPVETKASARIFYRRSCGCGILATVFESAGRPGAAGAPDRYSAFEEELLSLLREEEGAASAEGSLFLRRWESLLERDTSEEAARELTGIMAGLRRSLREERRPDEAAPALDRLDLAQAMLDEAARARFAREAILIGRNQQSLNQASLDILAAKSRAEVMDAIAQVSRQLEIPTCCLFRLEDEAVAGPAEALDAREFRTALWYDSGQRRFDREGRSGLIGDFLREIFAGGPEERTFIAKILHVEDKLQGMMLFDLGRHDSRTLEGLSRITSAALHGAWTHERLVETQGELRALVERDSLTGLGNRYSFYQRVRDLASLVPPGGPSLVALMFLDLDGFKPINDSFGHDAGDAALKETAARMSRALGEKSLGIFRIGGDEFTALVATSGPEESREIAGRLLDAIKEPFAYGRGRLHVSASLGCSHYPADGGDAEELVKYADLCMYRAKEAKGSAIVFDRAKDSAFLRRTRLAADVLRAVERDEIEVLYQGMFENDGALGGIEALARWRHPEYGLLPASDFIGLAARSNMIVPIESRILSLACGRAKALQASRAMRDRTGQRPGHRPFMLVNCTNTFFYCPNFVDIVLAAKRDAALDPGILRLGLAERVAHQDMDRALAIIGWLKSEGVDFAIDGMGSDSTINFLRELPADTIVKIDRGFVRHIHDSASDREFLYRMMALFEAKGLRVAVSGIERGDQMDALNQRDCLFQGFALAEPMEYDKLASLMDGR
jgi:diguanylate cyclase (GGDEF)-like protein